MNPDKQRIIHAFLKCPENKKLLVEYQNTNSAELKIQIDLEFKKFYQNYRILSYLIKVLHFESKHFDKQIRTHRNKNQLIIDSDINFTNIHLDNFVTDPIALSEDITDHISSDNLFNCVRKLTNRQRDVISLFYVKQMTEKEIAKKLGITQQAVSKIRNNVLENIRKELMYD